MENLSKTNENSYVVANSSSHFTIQRHFNADKIYQLGGTGKDHLAGEHKKQIWPRCPNMHQQHHNKHYEYLICSSVIYLVDSAVVQGYILFCKHFIAFFVNYFNHRFKDR